jgi:serine/threonine protein kinase
MWNRLYVLPLTTGTRLGEEYKATDTGLKRTVAIKVLPPHFAQREARVISNLNRPHICTLYGIGQQGGMRRIGR